MGRKAKRGAKKQGGRDVAPADGGASSGGEEAAAGAGAAATGLPMANLVRLMRQVIPKGVKISSSAKHLTHDCAVEFVGFVAGEASEQAAAQHRRIIAPEDFTRAFETLGFDDYVEPMTTYIRRYRDHQNVVHSAAAGYGTRPAPPPAAPAAVTAPGAPPCFSDEEMQYLRSTVVPPLRGEYDDDGSSSAAYMPAPAGHGCGYTG